MFIQITLAESKFSSGTLPTMHSIYLYTDVYQGLNCFANTFIYHCLENLSFSFSLKEQLIINWCDVCVCMCAFSVCFLFQELSVLQMCWQFMFSKGKHILEPFRYHFPRLSGRFFRSPKGKKTFSANLAFTVIHLRGLRKKGQGYFIYKNTL